MVTTDDLRKWALSLGKVQELPHFDKTSFRIRDKIFATVDEKKNLATLNLSIMDQSLFCTFDHAVIYPVQNKWGKQGWTVVNLALVPQETLKDALQAAFDNVFKKSN